MEEINRLYGIADDLGAARLWSRELTVLAEIINLKRLQGIEITEDDTIRLCMLADYLA